MKIKMSSIFFILLLITSVTNIFSMQHEILTGWAETLSQVLIGKPLQSALLEVHFNFTQLPPELRLTIIDLLTRNSTATTLEEATSTIRALTAVNKKLEEQINDPQFCLQIIKHLSEKFGHSNQDIAKELKTKEAKRRWGLQAKLWNGIFGPMFPESKKTKVPQDELDTFLDKLKKKGADFKFTYTIEKQITIIPEYAWIQYTNDNALLESITNHL